MEVDKEFLAKLRLLDAFWRQGFLAGPRLEAWFVECVISLN